MLFNIEPSILGIFILVLFLWVTLVSVWLYLSDRHYRKLVGKTNETDLKKILEKILDRQTEDLEYIKRVEEKVREIERQGLRHVQRVGVVRFNPFGDTGGEHSFSVALLDGERNGAVITGLHSREGTRTYVKPIEKGKSRWELSKEEKEALERAWP